MSVADIADALGCSTGTVKSRLNYARKKSRNDIEELERKETKLYSVAPLPFILWMLREGEQTISVSGSFGKGKTGCRHCKKLKCTHKRKYRFG